MDRQGELPGWISRPTVMQSTNTWAPAAFELLRRGQAVLPCAFLDAAAAASREGVIRKALPAWVDNPGAEQSID